MKNKNFAIIAAGGSGTRLGGDYPKQFLLLNGIPVLMHSMLAYHSAKTESEIILILSESMIDYWKEQCQKYQFDTPHVLIKSGTTRFQSIKNGVDYIQQNYSDTANMISVHDGARPLVTLDLIDRSYTMCDKYNNAICAIKSVNSIRIGLEDKNKAYDRDEVWLIQTPQVFKANLLFEAYQQDESLLFTDDSSVVEKLGYDIRLIEGEQNNIKITYQQDLAIAQLYLQNANN